MRKGKVAVVTGSTGGIGLGIAEALAKEGVNVTLDGSRASEQAESLRAGIQHVAPVEDFPV
jgi:3-hydroxybutyrate dehydrogenase